MFKKSLLFLLAFTLLALSTACSKKEDSSKTDAGNKQAQDTIKVWTYPVHGTYEDDLKELIADFNKEHPNIKVEYELLSWAEGPKKFDVALNAGEPPDLYFHGVSGQYVSTGLALELDPYMTQEIKDDYNPGMLELGQIQGKQYGLPIYTFQWAWGGNKRMLEEAGIDWRKIQAEGWTWAEFEEAAKKLTKDGQYALATNGDNAEFLDILARNNNLPDIVDEKGKFQWNDNRILDTLKFIDGLRQKGYMPKETAALTAQKRTDMMYNGQVAIISKAIPYYDRSFQIRNKEIEEGKKTGEKIDFVLLPVPHNEGAPAKLTSGAEGYVAFRQKKDKGEEHAKNTFLVMEALSGAKAGNSANELCLPFPRKSQVKLFEGKGFAKKENAETALRMQKDISTPVDLKIDVEVSANMKKFQEQVEKPIFQALLSGEKTPEQAAEEYKTKGSQMFKP